MPVPLRSIGPHAVVLISLLVTACSINSAGLVPEEAAPAARRIDKTVRIMPVDGGHASKFGREAYITNEQWHTAMKQALTDAGVFRLIVDSGEADLDLHSEIVTITTEGGLSPAYAMVVQYWLENPAIGEEVWRKGINSRHQVEWNEAFAGGTRIIMAVEGTAQKNLTRLVEELVASDL